ncbi:BamA/TamA family outer membrane protein [Solitalea canadensis]|uniref:Outer membrane protein/protective antigen OMA87 n=1 Tax=Solitalea canadensis (strain ATCC 29591 / DSM 3403 / JCM 21819 / LMG 8368 / NBRC 15130 / NCIMB 12057 / USAM 9D) TaxID=929556 RepID=H8KU32_SOLCM|nr:BamA/TamA family outer membrane protein [Solitalea canadensis]AFD07012.1 outer membrane protein/protective antigen OMA87 [Solitalea canadensis DSM 3403]
MNKLLHSLLLLLFLFGSGIVNAQQADSLTKKEKRQLAKKQKEKEGKFMITPLAGPAYTPELGFTIAGGVLTSWRMDKVDTTLQRSSAPFNIGWGSTGSYFFATRSSIFFKKDKYRLYTDLWFKNMDDNYFGIGYDNGRNTPKGDSTTGYTRTWFQIYPRFLWQFKKTFFAGAVLDINYTKGKDPSPGVAADLTYQQFNDKPFNSGFGLLFQHDTRDVAVNAWKGIFLEAQLAFYGGFLGGDNNYQVYSFDARKYFSITKPGHTLAFQLRGRFAVGSVPYGEMSQLGTPFDLRGYLWGQYRDKSMLFGIAEYRHTFYKKDKKPSKYGVVGWLGTGSIGEDPTEFKNWLPNGGFGFRVEVQPRMNLRLDYGLGKGSSGFYFNFQEAF